MSYGVPIIAPAVGGIPEMLIGTKNVLLPENPTVDEVIKAIRSIIQAEQNDILNLRSENVLRWNQLFNAKVNNEKFSKFLNEL